MHAHMRAHACTHTQIYYLTVVNDTVVSEYKMPKIIFEPKRKKVTGGLKNCIM